MKRNSTANIVLVAILVCVVWAAWKSGIGFAHNWFSFASNKIDIVQTLEADRLDRIVVEAGSTDVNIVRGRSDQIEVRLHGKTSASYKDKIELLAEAKGDTAMLEAKKPEDWRPGFRVQNLVMTVELPEKQWNEIRVDASSGNIALSELVSDSIRVEVGSGNLKLADSEAGEISLKTGSGNVSASGFQAETLAFAVRSGNVELKDGEAELKGETGSGNIRVEFAQLVRDAELATGSGNVAIRLDREPKSLSVDYRGKSGNGKIGWKGFDFREKDEDGSTIKGAFGGGGTKLKVTTGSGNFTLD